MAFLSVENISKTFPGVRALDDVSVDFEKGSVHALMGENGAGKSTLGKIIAGVYTPDKGTIKIEEREVKPTDPRIAQQQLGIALVHQELAFCPNMTVAENLLLGKFPTNSGFMDWSKLREKSRALLHEIGADIDVDTPLAQLTTGQEQMVQIAGAVGVNARIIIFDEPTSSLSTNESEHLFELLARLKQRGVAMLYVSHRMDEIFRVCDTITVLRDGKHVATEPIAQTRDRLIRQMVGREVLMTRPKHLDLQPGEEVLRVENLSSTGKFENVSFKVCRGEIVGMGGLVGAGRTEVATAIFGLDNRATGKVYIKGKEMPLGNVNEAMRRRIALLPEDRKKAGLVLGMSVLDNTSLAHIDYFSAGGFVDRKRELAEVEKLTKRLRVKAPSLETITAGLSGGNQQKVALAKWMVRTCDLLIVDEPTRGVDVGAKAEIYELLDEVACQGLAILMISSELPELLNLSRRVVVLREGFVTGELPHEKFSQEAVLHLMA